MKNDECGMCRDVYETLKKDTEKARNEAVDWQSVGPELLDLMKQINHAFYVEGTAKALRPVMAKTKDLIRKAEGK